jgi:large subunit ribosomal protein L10
MNTKISKNRQKKEEVVGELLQKVEKSNAIVFTNYQGLTHLQLEAIKKAVKKIDAEFVTTKNRLLIRALHDGKMPLENESALDGPTATLFIYKSFIEPLKVLQKTMRELKLPVIKFGIFEGKIVSDQEVVKITNLPPIPVLQAQLLGQMKAPISGLHRALKWNLQKFVLTLNAIKDKKPAQQV